MTKELAIDYPIERDPMIVCKNTLWTKLKDLVASLEAIVTYIN